MTANATNRTSAFSPRRAKRSSGPPAPGCPRSYARAVTAIDAISRPTSVYAPPLRREREPEEHAGDENVEHGPVSRSMSRDHEIPPRDDEGRHIDVVHADARLGEHRSVDEHGEADEGRQDRRR